MERQAAAGGLSAAGREFRFDFSMLPRRSPMTKKIRPVQVKKSKRSKSKSASPSKGRTSRAPAAPAKQPNVEAMKKTIAYYYLLSFCPPARISDFREKSGPLRKALADSAGMSEAAFFAAVLPEVCRRIVSFHEGTREPSKEWADALLKSAAKADQSPENASLFQAKMAQVARLPQRALPGNRLYPAKGCRFCRLPCRYGYFTLISEPVFSRLQRMLELEAGYPKEEQNPLRPVWAFAVSHLSQTLGVEKGVIQTVHLVNLAYCLLVLSMAKSRLAAPEAQLRAFQNGNKVVSHGG
jgi:hypothetical protein